VTKRLDICPTDRLLTVAEAAKYLNTSERFPRRLVEERRIRFVRLGEPGKRGHIRIPESALRELIAASVVEPVTLRGQGNRWAA
jgi:excisionase family DNA binding protein